MPGLLQYWPSLCVVCNKEFLTPCDPSVSPRTFRRKRCKACDAPPTDALKVEAIKVAADLVRLAARCSWEVEYPTNADLDAIGEIMREASAMIRRLCDERKAVRA